MAAQTPAGALLAPALTAELAAAFHSALAAESRSRAEPGAPAQGGEIKVLAVFARAGRTLAAAELELTDAQQAELSALGYRTPARASRAQLARVFLLVEACAALPPAQHAALLMRCYRTSDNEERAALLRALPLLPDPERFLAIATDACRTHVLGVFEAIACDNPYPARYFDQASFNQLVVKALFVGAALARVEGLRARHNPELSRMVRDYVSERRAAGRAIPEDVALVLDDP
jgi:hypothetical protein